METLSQFEARIATISNDELSKLVNFVMDDRNSVFVNDGSFAERQKIAYAEYAKRFVEILTVA